jgi:hypothetical protein
VPPPADSSAAFDLATRLDLAARVAARTKLTVLTADVGPAAASFKKARYVNVARTLRDDDTLAQVTSLAKGREIPLVILKGCALSLLDIGPSGARSFSDLDILVPVDRIPEMSSALVNAGWKLAALPPSEHQDPPLSHPSQGTIELHRCIPGVRVPGSRRSLDGRSVTGAGLSQPVPGFNGSVRAPSMAVLAAHALVHGIVQHGYAPDSYPLFRVLADLQDLREAGVDLQEATRFLREVDAEDLGAVETLLEALEAGTALDLAQSPPRALLSHLAAGTLDPGYSLALKSDPRFLVGLSDLPLPRLLIKRLWKVLFLSRERVDAIYGRPKRRGGYVARQVLRPADLALRLATSIRARLRAPDRTVGKRRLDRILVRGRAGPRRRKPNHE